MKLCLSHCIFSLSHGHKILMNIVLNYSVSQLSKSWRIAFLGVILACTASLLGAGNKSDNSDQSQLFGKWEVVSHLAHGETVENYFPVEFLPNGEMIVPHNITKKPTRLNYTLDLKNNPREITWGWTGRHVRYVVRGIYKIEDNILTICMVVQLASEQPDRPKDFSTKRGDDRILWILSRR